MAVWSLLLQGGSEGPSFIFRTARRSLVFLTQPAHRTGQADFPHPALGKDTHQTEIRHATTSATSEHNRGVARLIVNPGVLRRFLCSSLTRSLPSTGVIRLQWWYGPLRHPTRPVI